MNMYADKDYYLNKYKGSSLSNENVEKYLISATDDINTLTFNRIVGRKFENLTKFQQDIIQRVTCQFADFKYENEDILQSILSSYSINGVAMSFGDNIKVKIMDGVIIPYQVYKLLGQTGLTCRNVRC